MSQSILNLINGGTTSGGPAFVRGRIKTNYELADITFYEKFMQINADEAKRFIEERLDNLKEQIIAAKQEMMGLDKLLNKDTEEAITSYIRNTSGKKSYGAKAIVSGYMRDNLGKELTAVKIFDGLKTQGNTSVDAAKIASILFVLAKEGIIKKRYRGVYVMEDSGHG